MFRSGMIPNNLVFNLKGKTLKKPIYFSFTGLVNWNFLFVFLLEKLV